MRSSRSDAAGTGRQVLVGRPTDPVCFSTVRVHGPENSFFRIDRVWLPWRRKVRDLPSGPDGWGDGSSLGDDPISAIIAVVLLILLLPVLLFFLLAAVELLLLVLLVVPFAFARSLFGIPWTIRVSRNGVPLFPEQVKGWFASRRRMQELGELARTGQIAYLPGPAEAPAG